MLSYHLFIDQILYGQKYFNFCLNIYLPNDLFSFLSLSPFSPSQTLVAGIFIFLDLLK